VLWLWIRLIDLGSLGNFYCIILLFVGNMFQCKMSAPKDIPSVIQFIYTNYVVEKDKHKANCKICNSSISDTVGTTSGFTR
jgi:hypothetical protein